MAANSQDYGSLPEAHSPPKSSKRAMASVVAAAMLLAAAGAAALNFKTTAAPAALAAYDGSGVLSPRGIFPSREPVPSSTTRL